MTASESPARLLELRIFVVAPGDRAEFHRVSRDGTIPLMRRRGITVIGHGPCLDNDHGYYLLRAFSSPEQRVRQAEELYSSEEWLANYEEPVMAMIKNYHTEIMELPASVAEQLGARS
jgi:hypothetical protein